MTTATEEFYFDDQQSVCEKSTVSSEDSSTDDFSSDYDDDSSISSSSLGFFDDGDDEEEESSPRGLFLSSTMANLLRRSAGSDGDLAIQSLSEAQQPMRRCGSDVGVNTAESKLIFSIQTTSATENQSDGEERPRPYDVLVGILEEHGATTTTRAADSIKENFWVAGVTSSYTLELTDAIRQDNVGTVRQLHESGKHNLQCCNQFGESIVHTAARRGSTKCLRYMVQVADVSVRVCCDNGRNPLHDACWTGRPNFDSIRFLLQECPDFLLIKDKRGFTPLQYAPKDTWEEWANFLQENSDLLRPQEFVENLFFV